MLAGPGSGKTGVVVHRYAYLLRVRRVDPRGILVVCFNRNAALELRRRLVGLVGEDARGVTVQTYHGLAMRLTGCSFSERMDRHVDAGAELDTLIPRACDLLEGRAEIPGIEPDVLRDRLLAGSRHILVDEHQDIDADQYRLISALAGCTRDEGKLALLGVGDDDQNVYSFRGANVAHIHHFQDDYQAEVHFLVESYRSSGHINSAANALIAHNRDRLKTGRPIRVDARRCQDTAGGSWESLDPLTRGRVLVLEARDPESQAGALVERMRELRRLGDAQWSHFAVLARARSALEPLLALCEIAGIPMAWPTDLPPAHRMREIAGFLDWLKGLGQTTLTAESLLGAYIRRMAIDVDCGNTQPRPSTGPPLAPSKRGPSGERSQTPICEGSKERPIKKNPWEDIIRDLIRAWADEAGEAGVPANEIRELWSETLAEQRRDRTLGRGVLLAALHGAKGLEFPHVLIADDGWRAGQRGEDERRLLYVGMTRARQTLTLCSVIGAGNPWIDEVGGDWLMRLHPQPAPPPREITARRYHLLSPAHLDLGYAGRFAPDHRIHGCLNALQTTDMLQARAAGDRILLCGDDGFPVARLSWRGSGEWLAEPARIDSVKIVAMLLRRQGDGDPAFAKVCRTAS